MELDLVIWW